MCDLKKNYNIQPLLNISCRNYLAEKKEAVKSKAARARLKYLGGKCGDSGVVIFLYGETHQ